MSGKRRRHDLPDSDSDSSLADSPDHVMDSHRPAVDPTPPLTAHPGSDLRSSLTTAPGTDPRSALASALGTDPLPNPTTAGPSTDKPEPYLEPTGSYLVIKPVDENVSFRKVNVFWPTKYLGMICGTGLLDIETPANGTLVVKTETRAQTKALLKCTRFCEKDVTVSLHHARNTTKGTIFAPEMRYMSEEEILSGLRPEGVAHVRRLTTFKDGQRRDTSLLVITFNTTKLPDTLLAGHIRYEVRVFVPNPLRCFNCQRFGHGSKFCKQSARCQQCGAAPHDGSPCSAPVKCLSCDATDHTTNSNQCPVWKKEKEICSVKATTGVSYPQARRAVEEKIAKQPAKSYAQATQTQTASSGTQTDAIPELPPLKCLSPVAPEPMAPSATASTSTSQTPEITDADERMPSPESPPAVSPEIAQKPKPVGSSRFTGWTRVQKSSGSRPKLLTSSTSDVQSKDRQSRPPTRVAMGRSRALSWASPSRGSTSRHQS